MKEIIKKIQTRKLGGHILAAGIILLGLSLGFCIVKGNWEGVLSNAIWLTVACLSFKTMTRIDTLSDIIDTQERFIDRICDAIEVAKKKTESEELQEDQTTGFTD